MRPPGATNPNLRRSPLREEHLARGAHLGAFSGWEMPIHYGSIIREHQAVRSHAGLFDLSHLGILSLAGPGSEDTLDCLATNVVRDLAPGQGRYTLLLNEEGGIIDDIIVYRLEEERFLAVVNAARREADVGWMDRERSEGCAVTDRSGDEAVLALQGPRALDLLAGPLTDGLDRIARFELAAGEIAGVAVLVARTGYTGEDGFELIAPRQALVRVWRALLEQEAGPAPAGLGARDSLRLEMGYPLYGSDIDEGTSPWEAGLHRFVRPQKGKFIGRDAFVRSSEALPARMLVCLRMRDRSIPRAGAEIVHRDAVAGAVTSGGYAPSLRRGIALGYVETRLAEPGQAVGVRIRGRDHPALVAPRPLYRKE